MAYCCTKFHWMLVHRPWMTIIHMGAFFCLTHEQKIWMHKLALWNNQLKHHSYWISLLAQHTEIWCALDWLLKLSVDCKPFEITQFIHVKFLTPLSQSKGHLVMVRVMLREIGPSHVQFAVGSFHHCWQSTVAFTTCILLRVSPSSDGLVWTLCPGNALDPPGHCYNFRSFNCLFCCYYRSVQND